MEKENILNLAYKYRLYPSIEQEKKLNSFFALQRKNWNCLLATSIPFFEDNQGKSKEDRTPIAEWIKAGRKAYKELRNQEGNEWTNEVLSNHRFSAYNEQSLARAWGKYLDDLKNGKVAKLKAKYSERSKLTGKKFNQKHYDNICKPCFKSRFDDQSYTCDKVSGLVNIDIPNGELVLSGSKKEIISIPFKISNKDKLLKATILKANKVTLSKDNTGCYFVSIAVAIEHNVTTIKEVNSEVGVDMGCVNYATLSTGEIYDMPDTSRLGVRIKSLQFKLSASYEANKDNKDWDKKNWLKLKLKIAKLHKKQANIRSNATHEFTNQITNAYDFIGVEKLNIAGMTKASAPKLGEDEKTFVRNNKKQKAGLNRSILSKNFHETRLQLTYKAEWKGKYLVAIDPKYTSQECNSCGAIHKENRLTQSDFKCIACGHEENADVNAAKNILYRAKKLAS